MERIGVLKYSKALREKPGSVTYITGHLAALLGHKSDLVIHDWYHTSLHHLFVVLVLNLGGGKVYGESQTCLCYIVLFWRYQES